MSGYTGIAEIDVVLLDLYGEKKLLEEALRIKPRNKVIMKRHERVVTLASRLLEFGRLVQATASIGADLS